MEHVRTRDNNSDPPLPIADLATPTSPASPPPLTPNRRESDVEHPVSPPSSTADAQNADKSRFWGFEPPQPKPLFRGFERPSFSRIAILTVLCPLAYPAFYILTIVAKNKSLSIVRLIVSAWCSVIGFALGYIILAIGAQHLEAASEFTLVWCQHFLRPFLKQPGPP